jgi:DNA-binding response OmpR family regulator
MKILIVEDDPKIASFLKKGLMEEYFIVDISDNGDEAIYLATLGQYDLIILDLMIFGSDGYEVCKKLREEKIQTPIIVLSAKSAIDDKVSLLNLGADDYLTKPFSFDELLARIRVHLRKKEQKDNILTIADLELNLTTKKVKRGENTIQLTAKEYAILEYLLRNKNNIINEATLQNSIAGFEELTTSNTINVYIYRLRTKIDKDYELKLIKTYRNQGFTISDTTF